MTYVPLHASVYSHRKTLKLTRILHIEVDSMVGKLGRLWNWAMDNAPDGQLIDIDAGMIADVMNWQDDENRLLEALMSAGFIEKEPDGVMILHAWEEYGGRLNQQRARNAAKQKAYRDRHVTVTSQVKEKKSKEKENIDLSVAQNGHADAAPPAQAGAARIHTRATPSEKKPRTPKQQERDEIWQALETAAGHPCPAGQETTWGKMVSAFKEKYQATPEEIIARAQVHRQIKDWDFTLNSLMKWWYDCDPMKLQEQQGSNGSALTSSAWRSLV